MNARFQLGFPAAHAQNSPSLGRTSGNRPLKAHANGLNKCQQLPTLLGVVGQQCCVRLRGPKSLTGFKQYAASANKCQHCCSSMQTDATSHNIVGPNNVGCCWPTMLGPFAWAFRASSDSEQSELSRKGYRLLRQLHTKLLGRINPCRPKSEFSLLVNVENNPSFFKKYTKQAVVDARSHGVLKLPKRNYV